MSNIVAVDIGVDPELLEAKLMGLLDKATMLECHNELARYCDPYVPFLEGPLSQTIEVTPEYVRYTQPYAHYQYVGEEFNHTTDYHPLASAYWDQAMMRDKGEEFLAQIKRIITERHRDG